ncbi:MAG: cytochrome c, partial [Saprospiraceae bacterium]|nr:cytochrome c [Saprospiraceae bacterium]
MYKFAALIALSVMIIACGGGADDGSTQSATPKSQASAADEGKGIGEIKHVELNNPLDPAMVKRGESIYQMKCAACHKLTEQRVVGPGWAGVTDRRKPEWIMNMTTNVDVMLEEDPAAREL